MLTSHAGGELGQCQLDPWIPSQCAAHMDLDFAEQELKPKRWACKVSVVEKLITVQCLYTWQLLQPDCSDVQSLSDSFWGNLGTAWEVAQNEYEKGCSGKAFVVVLKNDC